MIKHGWLNIDKPEGMSSAKVVAIVKKLLKAKRVGHAGTLDPIATGVLPIAFGQATKTIQFVQGAEKEYVFTLKFGEATDSYDRTGKVIAKSTHYPQLDEIKAELKNFIGVISQVPPVYSAIRVDGKRAYEMARAGQAVSLAPREILVKDLQIESFDETLHEVVLKVICGKGTYVRSVAHDLAQKLGSLGHVTELRRTRVGIFDKKNIISLAKLEEIVHTVRLEDALLPTWRVLDDILALDFSQEEVRKMIHGIAIKLPEQTASINELCVIAKLDGAPVAIGKIIGQYFKPTTIFN